MYYRLYTRIYFVDAFYFVSPYEDSPVPFAFLVKLFFDSSVLKEKGGFCMKHESNEQKKFYVEDTDFGFMELQKKKYYPQKYHSDIQMSNIVLIPFENFRDNYILPVFPEETEKYFKYLVKNSGGIIKPEICAEDETYAEVELHSDLIILPNFIVTSICLPMIINLTSSYLYDISKNRKRDLTVKVDMYVEDGDKKKRFSYEGDSKQLESTIKTACEKFFNEGDKDEL